MKNFQYAPKQIYDQFGKYFPFSTVDVIIFQQDSILLIKRKIIPYKGKWHFPGGLIRKNEKIKDAAKRVVKVELNLDIKLENFLGVYENPIRTRHDITHCFIATMKNKINNDYETKSIKFFQKIPNNTIPYHKLIIKDAFEYMKIAKKISYRR
ncbi:MAG: NUDIX hydrolase [Nitrosotalea sp.]